jgi:hypothetical protein
LNFSGQRTNQKVSSTLVAPQLTAEWPELPMRRSLVAHLAGVSPCGPSQTLRLTCFLSGFFGKPN